MISHDFTGRVALITGGTRGIGRATAELLAAAGARVALTSRSAEAAAAAAAEIAAAAGADPTAVTGHGAHAADPAAADAAAAAAAAAHGRLDILVNNAGTNPAYGPLTRQPQAALDKTMAVNALAPVSWARAAVDHGLGAHPGAAIVNVSSIGALAVEDGLGAYDAAKAALLHITRQLARELAPAVRVNAVSPGIVRTRLSEALWSGREAAVAATTPLGRLGEPVDVAAAIAFLAGEAAAWITGANLVIDGGQLIGVGAPGAPGAPEVAGAPGAGA